MPDFALRRPAYAAVRLHLPPPPPRALRGETMGTRWSLKYAPRAGVAEDAILRSVDAALATVVAQMSTWEPSSAISAYNRAAAGSDHALAGEFGCVVERALHWARETGGAFDPTVGPLTDRWGFGCRPGPRDYAGARPPEAADRAAAQAAVGWRRLRYRAADRRLRQPGGLRLDLSGIAKGFAVDLVGDALAALGITDHLMEIGGELRARGRRPDGRAWTVGIEHGEGTGSLPLPLQDRAVATSGDRWHAYEHAGRRYGHTLDPRTGAPVAHDLASVTVVHPRCIDADALATALLVLGPRAGPAFAERHGIAAWFVRRTGRGPEAHPSAAFARLAA